MAMLEVLVLEKVHKHRFIALKELNLFGGCAGLAGTFTMPMSCLTTVGALGPALEFFYGNSISSRSDHAFSSDSVFSGQFLVLLHAIHLVEGSFSSAFSTAGAAMVSNHGRQNLSGVSLLELLRRFIHPELISGCQENLIVGVLAVTLPCSAEGT